VDPSKQRTVSRSRVGVTTDAMPASRASARGDRQSMF